MKHSLAIIAALGLFVLFTVFGLGILDAPANATTPTSCKISVVSPLTQMGKSVSGKFSSNCPTTIGLAVYGAPGPKFDPKTADQQTFEGVEHVDLPCDGKLVTASATVPGCYFQADAFTGDVILKLSPTNLYGARLLSSASGGSKPCESTTTTTAAPTTITTVAGTDHDTGFVPTPTSTIVPVQLTSAQELPHTGFPFEKAILRAVGLVVVGLVMLTIVGVALTDSSRRA
jgi:hypothetical protein